MPPKPTMAPPPPPPRRKQPPPPAPRKRMPPPPPPSRTMPVALVSPLRTDENNHRPRPPPSFMSPVRRTPGPVPVTPLRHEVQSPNRTPPRGQKRPFEEVRPIPYHKRFRCCRSVREVYDFSSESKIGQGTFGSVFKATHKQTGRPWALKLINPPHEPNSEEGISITALREVKLLSKLRHPNVVFLKEVVDSLENRDGNGKGAIPQRFFLVLEHCDYDLAGIVGTPEIQYSWNHIHSWSCQLLKGLQFIHNSKVLHRDIKSANLLINKRGELKIADFGLAVPVAEPQKRLTHMVQSLWYRAPELLLHCYQYTAKIDTWSVGCILAELVCRKPLFRGTSEDHQLQLILSTLPVASWAGAEKECRRKVPAVHNHMSLRQRLRSPRSQGYVERLLPLITNLLQVNPAQRWSATQAVQADLFRHAPRELRMDFGVETAHEWGCRRQRQNNNEMPAQQQQKTDQKETGYVNRLLSNWKHKKPQGKTNKR
ncbi:Mitogen-activated protein kinase HOG1 (Fragment) [Seminavis robusta]|uniref:Cyclin-dependent kinase 2 homolog n=1 Tax=Seminavis robusta TaxID=568900 RepID=A0A9N8EG02_9STRA